MDGFKDGIKIIQVSDTHNSAYKNRLDTMIESINNEKPDAVILTGDILDSNDNEHLFKDLKASIGRIEANTYIIPGDYDGGLLWRATFPKPNISFMLGEYTIDCIDTSCMNHTFETGWGDWALRPIFKTQSDFLTRSLGDNRVHVIFSHHPFIIIPREKFAGFNVITSAVRGCISGHYHTAFMQTFGYPQPKFKFDGGFSVVPYDFHGESSYVRWTLAPEGELISTLIIDKIGDLKKRRGVG